MKKRRPTAADREIANAIRTLPIGEYRLTITADSQVLLKPEGGRIIGLGNSAIATIVPDKGVKYD